MWIRLGRLVVSLLGVIAFLLGPAAAPAGAIGPVNRLVAWLQRMPRQVVIDGHCQLVDSNGVPLVDELFYQRTGHDPC
jgi:hypothetical protein